MGYFTQKTEFTKQYVSDQEVTALTNKTAQGYFFRKSQLGKCNLALDTCKEELTKVLQEKNNVQYSLHACSQRQKEVRDQFRLSTRIQA